MESMTAIDFFLRLPPKQRRTVMLKAAKDATNMQRKVMMKAGKLAAKKAKKR